MSVVTFYRRFIPHVSHILAVLTNLLRKDVKFLWNEQTEAAFIQMPLKNPTFVLVDERKTIMNSNLPIVSERCKFHIEVGVPNVRPNVIEP